MRAFTFIMIFGAAINAAAWCLPVDPSKFIVNSAYGPRNMYWNSDGDDHEAGDFRKHEFHPGIDFKTYSSEGIASVPLRAVGTGEIIEIHADLSADAGYYIGFKVGDYQVRYLHLSKEHIANFLEYAIYNAGQNPLSGAIDVPHIIWFDSTGAIVSVRPTAS